jgi:hypothetical protein
MTTRLTTAIQASTPGDTPVTTSITTLARAGVAALALTTLATGAQASLVESPNGDPFPEGSLVLLSPEDPFNTPFGWVREIQLSGFEASPSIQPNNPTSGDYRYRYYNVLFSNAFWSDATGGTQMGSFEGSLDSGGPGFNVVLFDRGGIVTQGTFAAEI